MEPRLSDPDLRLFHGDALEVLRELPDASVDCCVTSPPYWGLRDYGTGTWEGGSPECEHVVGGQVQDSKAPGAITNGQRPGVDASTCRRCGAHRLDSQIGLEPTPELYVAKLVELFREVRRVLAPHGTVWLNLGDSYASGGRDWYEDDDDGPGGRGHRRRPNTPPKLKPKDLVGIPWKVAFALQEDGWWLRMDIVWNKPNAMPESVSDRPTRSHEYLFLLTKSGSPTFWTNALRGLVSATKPKPDYWWFPPPGVEGEPSETEVEGWKRRNAWKGRDYFYDQDAVREPAEWARWGDQTVPKYEGTKTKTGWMQPTTKAELRRKGSVHRSGIPGGRSLEAEPTGSRNIRSVWTINTKPYPQAHFATFPEKLPLQAISAGCPTEVCLTCGKPRTRVTERRVAPDEVRRLYERKSDFHTRAKGLGGQAHQDWLDSHPKETLGFTSCGHDNFRPGIVLDPFAGAGTTALVARKLSRHSLLIELSDEYCDLIAERLQQLSLLT